MASKWAKLKGKLPNAPASDMKGASDPSFMEKVDAAKSLAAGLSLPELMSTLSDHNKEWDELEERKKELNVEFEAIGQLIMQHFESQGVTSVKDVEGKTFGIHIEPYIGVKDKEAFERWVMSDPRYDYLWSVHPQTLASLVKERLDKGEDEQVQQEMPFLSIFLKSSIRVKKA